MALKVAVAAPFVDRGSDRLPASEFVVALSLDRDWFSPDQAKRLADRAVGRGMLERDGDDLVVAFDREAVAIPDGFAPDESLLQVRSTFEVVLDAAVDAGAGKQETVAAINETQARLGVSVEAAAVVHARRAGLDAAAAADRARAELGTVSALAGTDGPEDADGADGVEPTPEADGVEPTSEADGVTHPTDTDGRRHDAGAAPPDDPAAAAAERDG